jgi:hypothetical protein
MTSLLHFALVEHTVCPEHGELTHGHAPPAAAMVLAPPGPDATVEASDGEQVLAHEHCVPPANRTATFDLPQVCLVSTSETPGETTLLAWSPEWSSQRNLYRTAPKTSPPV